MIGEIKLGTMALVLGFGLFNQLAASCPDDSVASGTVCIDKYEASVWFVPPEQRNLIHKIQKGSVRLSDLTDAGAIQLGFTAGDLAANGCPATGNGCVSVYAVSIPGVTPAAFVTWFQAAAAARNSGKRLPTNQEWQVAALGTPDGAPCNVSTGTVANTGNSGACVSDVGAFDMVGNVAEKVADWGPYGNTCTTWPLEYGGDRVCHGGTASLPGALHRGGFYAGGAEAGVFSVVVHIASAAPFGIGFRCAR